MLNIAICDDDLDIVEQMKKIIKTHDKEDYLINTYTSGEELLNARKSFDVIFLDIDMHGINGIETAKEEEELIEFITTDGIKRLTSKEIYFFEYFDRKVQMKTINGTYLLKKKITDVSKFMNQYGFFMPHKSFSVNLFYVKSVKGYDIYMMDGSIIPLSQKKSVEFKEQLNIFLGDHI